MIENLLVDPEVILEAIRPVRHKTSLTDLSKVEGAMNQILDELSEHEVDRRVKSGVGFHAFRLEDPVNTAKTQVTKHIEQICESACGVAIEKLREEAQEEVARLEREGKRREKYDGKKILNVLYRKYLHRTSMSKRYSFTNAQQPQQSVSRSRNL